MRWFGPEAILGECPRWDDSTQRLTWVDIDGGTLHEAMPGAGGWVTVQHDVAASLAGAVLLEARGTPDAEDGENGENGEAGEAGEEERWLVAVGGSLAEWAVPGGLGPRRVVEAESAACPVRLNEVVTDPCGRLWIGSMAYDWTEGAGSFYRVDLDGSVHRVLEDITISNGIGWSPDTETMYTTDTAAGRITAWAFDSDAGAVSRPRSFVDAGPDEGRPDGLAVDMDGNVWSAFAGGFHVSCFDPSGREIERVRIPAPNPTSCCFAGPGRDRLIVTTGRKRLPPDVLVSYPDSGRTWDAGVVGARGLPQHRGRVRLADQQEVRPDGR